MEVGEKKEEFEERRVESLGSRREDTKVGSIRKERMVGSIAGEKREG